MFSDDVETTKQNNVPPLSPGSPAAAHRLVESVLITFSLWSVNERRAAEWAASGWTSVTNKVSLTSIPLMSHRRCLHPHIFVCRNTLMFRVFCCWQWEDALGNIKGTLVTDVWQRTHCRRMTAARMEAVSVCDCVCVCVCVCVCGQSEGCVGL